MVWIRNMYDLKAVRTLPFTIWGLVGAVGRTNCDIVRHHPGFFLLFTKSLVICRCTKLSMSNWPLTTVTWTVSCLKCYLGRGWIQLFVRISCGTPGCKEIVCLKEFASTWEWRHLPNYSYLMFSVILSKSDQQSIIGRSRSGQRQLCNGLAVFYQYQSYQYYQGFHLLTIGDAPDLAFWVLFRESMHALG